MSDSSCSYDRGDPGWNTDWNNVAPNVGVAWRPNVQGGFLRKILGDPEQATLRAGYSVDYAAKAWPASPASYGANPGSQVSVTPLRRASATWCSPAARLAAAVQRARPARGRRSVPGRRRPIRIAVYDRGASRAGQHQHLPPGHPGRVRPDVHGELPARAVARHGGRHPLRRHARRQPVDGGELQRDQHHRERVLRRVPARPWPTSRPTSVAGRGNTFAFTGRTGHVAAADLPGVLQRLARRQQPGGVHRAPTGPNRTFVGRLARARTRSPYDAATDLDGNATRRANALAAGCAPNFFVLNPDVDRRRTSIWTSDAYSSYDALQIELRRRLSRGFQISGSYQYALEYGSAYLGKH